MAQSNTSSAYYDTRYPIGGSVPGNAAMSSNLFFLPNGNSLGNAGGVLGGAQVGYNFQFGQFVIGAETDFQGTSISGSGTNGTLTFYTRPSTTMPAAPTT